MYDNNNMEMLAGMAVLGMPGLNPHWMEIREDYRQAQKAPHHPAKKRGRFGRLLSR